MDFAWGQWLDLELWCSYYWFDIWFPGDNSNFCIELALLFYFIFYIIIWTNNFKHLSLYTLNCQLSIMLLKRIKFLTFRLKHLSLYTLNCQLSIILLKRIKFLTFRLKHLSLYTLNYQVCYERELNLTFRFKHLLLYTLNCQLCYEMKEN